MFFGFLLIVIGGIFLLKQLGILTGSAWGVIWPAALIFWGLVVIARGKRGQCWCCHGKKENKENKVEING